jgi:beta-glucanase (GH16 family)
MKELLWEAKFDNMDNVKKEWSIEEHPPRSVNNELQSYTHDSVSCRNGELIITTTKDGNHIKSGRLNSKDKVQIKYGYIEAEIKFGGGKGLWPAFWAMGNTDIKWPDRGELDIMEWVGWNECAIYGTLHGPGYCGGNCLGSGGKRILNKPLQNEYHKYAVEWKPNSIKWYIDNILFYEANRDILHKAKHNSHWVYDERPFYLILNMAVGGEFGGAYHGYPNDVYNNLPHTTEMHIKSVKVYKTDDGCGSIIKSH